VSAVETLSPSPEIVREITRAGGEAFRFCYQCGTCDVVCPWNRVTSFSIRKIIRQADLGLPEIELDDIWRCTTCGTCPARCPRGVDQIEVVVALRRLAARYDVFPGAARTLPSVRASLASDGNPLNEPRARRGAWADGLGVKPFTEGMEILYFVGCYASYDPRTRRVAAATARILDRAGVDFGILGARESCCGESIRKAGCEQEFKTLARENIKAFIDHGVKRILVGSPHCYHTFRNEYSEFMMKLEVVHVAQYLEELFAAGRLALGPAGAGRGAAGPLAPGRGRLTRVAYHDPCYLGRHNGIFDPPRDVLRRLPGLELVELRDARDNSLCCGGGGARIWMDTDKRERFADLRLAQAREAGAEILVTSCPYCISNFEVSRLALLDGAGDNGARPDTVPEIRDLTEVAWEALAEGAAAP
jgi:Fe-S oxidoreductase